MSLPTDAPRRILVVDDDKGQRSLLGGYLRNQGFDILFASSGEEALAAIESEPIDMMISDVRMPGMSGLETLRRTRLLRPGLPVLLVTAYADIHDAVGAMRDGAVSYLEKPIDLDELFDAVSRALGAAGGPFGAAEPAVAKPDNVVAESSAMRTVLKEAALVAPSESRALITGESGVGKEIVADLIHGWSRRAAGPIVKVNCAAIPETLLESELFGHEKGAFTGATARRVGRFEEANGGTIFLDEIAEMSPALQARLLRVTQDGSFQRVGSNAEIRSDARILAATNRNLESEIKAGRFREDLFFRLNVFEIYVPPLRERIADIPALARHFLERFSGAKGRISPLAIKALEQYHWPGNVRELQNAMERAALMASGEVVMPEHLPRRVRAAAADDGLDAESEAGAKARKLDDVERSAILKALRENQFNRSETARQLGISRRALLYKLRRYAEEGFVIDEE